MSTFFLLCANATTVLKLEGVAGAGSRGRYIGKITSNEGKGGLKIVDAGIT
jgi:hypothetical protein